MRRRSAIASGFRSVIGKPKRRERFEESRCVLECRPYEDVEIAGEPRSAVKGKRVRTDDDELNAMGSQGPYKLVEAAGQLHQSVSASIRRPRRALQEAATTSGGALAASALPRGNDVRRTIRCSLAVKLHRPCLSVLDLLGDA